MAATKVLKVKATAPCYVGHKRRKPGSTFQVSSRSFSPRCMVLLEGEIPADVVKKFPKKEFGNFDKPQSPIESEEFDEIEAESSDEIDSPPGKSRASDLDVL